MVFFPPGTDPNILNSMPPEQWAVWMDGGEIGPAPHTLPKQSVKNCIINKDFHDGRGEVQFTKGMRGRMLEQYDILGGRSWAKVVLDGTDNREHWVLGENLDVVADKQPKA